MPCEIAIGFYFRGAPKHTTTADHDYWLLYYQDADKFEGSIVLENTAGHLVGIDIKAPTIVDACR
ncbi:MAG: hypothetical protein C0631_10710 [Sedimenticola sp.]|jgi:hypothetical protein|nr:MAG: hypothetical protein C0631_10710 [Sedimenticola sp.]